MREVPMLFSDPMVRAIFEDRKDQTRRVVTPQPWKNGNGVFWRHGKASEIEADYIHSDKRSVERLIEKLSPIQPGDVIWGREAAQMRSVGPGKGELTLIYRADEERAEVHDFNVPEGEAQPYSFTRWTPGMYMPRWASRIRLQVLLVQAQRVQEITEADCMREGIYELARPAGTRFTFDGTRGYFSPISAYELLWNELNEERGHGWRKNPWVLVTTFKRLSPG